jgi:hypothetical protein
VKCLSCLYEPNVDMHFVYGFYNGNGRAAVAEYWQHFSNHRFTHGNVFYSIYRSMRETNSFP